MKSENLVILVGNVGKAPEVRNLSNESKVANFSVATNDSYTNKDGEEVKNTDWHKVVAWGKLAEIVEKHVGKGSSVYVKGELKPKTYKDDKDVTHRTYEVKANEIILCGAKPSTKDEPSVDESKSES